MQRGAREGGRPPALDPVIRAQLLTSPRLPGQDFGLDVAAFCNMVGDDCPAAFLQLAFHCCRVRVPLFPSLPLGRVPGPAPVSRTPKRGSRVIASNRDPHLKFRFLVLRPAPLPACPRMGLGSWHHRATGIRACSPLPRPQHAGWGSTSKLSPALEGSCPRLLPSNPSQVPRGRGPGEAGQAGGRVGARGRR